MYFCIIQIQLLQLVARFHPNGQLCNVSLRQLIRRVRLAPLADGIGCCATHEHDDAVVIVSLSGESSAAQLT